MVSLRLVLRVRRKGVVILPKRLREALGVREGDEIVAEIREGAVVLRPLKPVVVDVDPGLVEGILREEYELEKRRYAGMVTGEEAGGRH